MGIELSKAPMNPPPFFALRRDCIPLHGLGSRYTFLPNEPKLFEKKIMCINPIYRNLHRFRTVFSIGFVLENEPNFRG